MSHRFRSHAFSAGSPRLAALLAVSTLALAGCGSTAATKPASHSSITVTQPLALTPAQPSRQHVKPARRPGSTPGTAATTSASAPCPAGEQRTATALCYSPAAQTRLVKKLGPCLAGQVVADNGACQPLTSRRPTHQRGSLQGAGRRNARGPGFDTVFH